jgi:hypothetical protein
MTISEDRVREYKVRLGPEPGPVEIVRPATTKGSRNARDGGTPSLTARIAGRADEERNYYAWSTPASAVFFGILIILALLFAELVRPFVDLRVQ